ncbi:MAG: hypothetical protein ACYCZR_08275 [Burkholderiales bacterium]
MNIPLQLRQYFFTKIECNANPEYNPAGNLRGTHITPKFGSNLLDGQNAIAIECAISVDRDASENVPYFFEIAAFGVLDIMPDTPQELALNYAQVPGIQILVGAIRESLAGITARGPWGSFVIPMIAITPVAPASPEQSKQTLENT